MGLLNNVVPFCLIVWAQTQIASGLAAIDGRVLRRVRRRRIEEPRFYQGRDI
jgi:hypothetical protein